MARVIPRSPSRLALWEASPGQVALDPLDIIFDPTDLNRYELHIPSVLDATLKSIQFDRKKSRPDADKSHAEADWGRKEQIITFQLLVRHRPFLEAMIVPLFWLAHLTLNTHHFRFVKTLKKQVGRIWHSFIYPLRTGMTSQREVDKFISRVPYFMTQAIQDIFIRLVAGNPTMMSAPFRMKLCSLLVGLFSGVQPIDTLLKSRLPFFFRFPPQADVPDQIVRPEDDSFERVTLPIEDTSTLIETERRRRPIETSWRVAGVSPFFASVLGRPTIPYTRDAKLNVQVPKNGEADWTTDLPPLLPPCIRRGEDLTVKAYDPVGETRSLTARSRRPHVVQDHAAMRRVFEANQREREEKRRQATAAKKRAMECAREWPSIILSDFVEKLQRMPIERKREEVLGIEAEVVAGPLQNDQAAEEEEKQEDLEPRSGVVGLLDERDLKDLDDADEERAYVREAQANHPVHLEDIRRVRE